RQRVRATRIVARSKIPRQRRKVLCPVRLGSLSPARSRAALEDAGYRFRVRPYSSPRPVKQVITGERLVLTDESRRAMNVQRSKCLTSVALYRILNVTVYATIACR